MLGPFPFSGTHASQNKPSVGSATKARGYARHYLWNASILWGVASLVFISGLGFLIAQRPLKEEMLFYAAASVLGVLLAYAFWRTSRALIDLRSEPVSFEGRVASKNAYIFWYKLAFLEEKYYLNIVRGIGMRPLTLGSGKIIKEGWFLAAQGYYDLLAPGDQVRGTIYARTRVIDSLIKV
ncbi:MAG: hypothetical protein F4X91_12790 [Nitrospinae bacterium]|nr:hypothetical protein [Nitrospinota bacterium]